MLSVNVGLLNLFPIPALDGGRIVFLGYEAITRKKPNPKVEKILITVTMFLLLGLIAFVTLNDIIKLF
jgi:regulator of sigma E protease